MKVRIEKIDPIDFFLKLSKERNVCFLHSCTKDGWKSIIAFNPDKKLTGDKVSPKKLQEFIDQNQKNLIIGYISYEYGVKLHKIRIKTKNDLKTPKINFNSFENYIEFFNNKTVINYKKKGYLKLFEEILNRRGEKFTSLASKNFKAELSQADYVNAYKKIKKHIKQGDIYQINLTHRLKAKSNIPAKSLFKKIINYNPVGFLAYIEGKGFEILSASPERFVKIKKNNIFTTPIKGTRPRFQDIKKDKASLKKLINSEKEASELNMITDLLRNDIGKISKIGSIKLQGTRLIQKCPKVWHTYSKINSKLNKDIHPIEALLDLLPGGSISGCPKKRALEVINEVEQSQRGVYTGIVGYIKGYEDMDFNIAIRTILKRGKDLYLSVGGGIVYDSKDKAELKETYEKAASFMKILC
ncbi:hypothetical protein GF354_02190 [Candidatus Peregrinibacteria bacterium]|nr:hypothetical protein [Candidatus Peregrinibacteria bacterium]